MWKNLAGRPIFWYNVKSGKSRNFVPSPPESGEGALNESKGGAP